MHQKEVGRGNVNNSKIRVTCLGKNEGLELEKDEYRLFVFFFSIFCTVGLAPERKFTVSRETYFS